MRILLHPQSVSLTVLPRLQVPQAVRDIGYSNWCPHYVLIHHLNTWWYKNSIRFFRCSSFWASQGVRRNELHCYSSWGVTMNILAGCQWILTISVNDKAYHLPQQQVIEGIHHNLLSQMWTANVTVTLQTGCRQYPNVWLLVLGKKNKQEFSQLNSLCCCLTWCLLALLVKYLKQSWTITPSFVLDPWSVFKL